MKVETPQILWHAEGDKKLAASLSSISMIESGVSLLPNHKSYILATASGTSPDIHLWKLEFPNNDSEISTDSVTTTAATITTTTSIFQSAATATENTSNTNNNNNLTKIEFVCCLSSRHERGVNALKFSPDGLHLASASSSVVVYSVPFHARGNSNGQHFWTTITQDKTNELLTTIAHRSTEDITDLSWSSDSKRVMGSTLESTVFVLEKQQQQQGQVQEVFKLAFRSSSHHSHYVQGVAFDPANVYLASQSSDRTVRVLMRNKKKMTKYEIMTNKSKQIKYNTTSTTAANNSASTTANSSSPTTTTIKKQHWYADEATLEAFHRRLDWTPDGAYLITPAALYSKDNRSDNIEYATLMFQRHYFDEPCKILPGLNTPSIAVRSNPVLFYLPDDDKENSTDNIENNAESRTIPYRSYFCVLTWDSVLLYDTFHDQPVSIIRNSHYANIVDATWSHDGHTLLVCSSDGYISIIRFDRNELGTVYVPPPKEEPEVVKTSSPCSKSVLTTKPSSLIPLPPCEPGTDVLEGPPNKKTRISTPPKQQQQQQSQTKEKRPPTPSLDQLTLEGENAKKKQKKRIQPTLMSVRN